MDVDLSLVDAIPELIWIAHTSGAVVSVNQRWRDYTGLRDQDAWETAVHPDDRPMFLDEWRSSLSSGEPFEIEARLRRADGAYRRFLISGNPIRDAEGLVARWCAVSTDIEERKQAEEALRSADRYLYSMVDTIPGPVAVTGPDGMPEHANSQFLGYFGITFEQLKHWTTANVIHPDFLAHDIESWTVALTTGCNHEVESVYRRADGVYRWCHTRGFPLRDSDGRIVRWFVLMTDIDDRKRAEALLAGEKRVLEMVAGGRSLSATLEELCRIVESIAIGCRCAVFLANSEVTRIEHGVGPSMPASFLECVVGRPIAIDSGPAAMACYLNEQVIATDLPSETRWASGWTSTALGHGVRACWATPFTSRDGKVLGAFLTYYNEPRTADGFPRSLIEPFAQIASIAVERAQNDEALMRSEARKAAILDSSLDCIITIDDKGCIAEFNHAAERTFGCRRDAAIGKRAEIFIPVARPLAEVLGTRIEMSARRADGSEFPVELAITRMTTDGPSSFTGLLRDISQQKREIEERKWAETQLAGEKQLLEMIASGRSLTDVLTALCKFVEEASADCICAVHLIDWSSQIFHDGAAPSLADDYIETLDGIAVQFELGPCADAAVTRRQVIGEDLRTEPRWKGTPFEMLAVQLGLRSVWSTPIFALGGEVLGTFAMYQRKPAVPSGRQQELIAQVTHIASIAIEREHAESALKRSGALLAEGERLSLTGTFWWRVATGEITWSDQVYRIFDFDRSAPVTLERIGSRLHPEDIDVFQQVLDRARADAADFEYEIRLQMPGGPVKYLHIMAHSTRDNDGRLEYIGAVHDVTDRRSSDEALGKLRSELAHVARVSSLGTLTASIAHEVNQPLSGIITNASTCMRMLDADPPNIDGARETARRTIRDGHRASEVITRLRGLFSKNAGPYESVDLNEATREVIALSQSELQRKRVVVRPELADDLPPVTGDRVQLQQVILNLLLNASDAMRDVDDRPRQAVITTQQEEGDGVRVTVRDAGEGLEARALEKVFEPFYTTKNDGMGIGLAVSRSIIENHRGRIWAAANDGPGATFSFSIPSGINGNP